MSLEESLDIESSSLYNALSAFNNTPDLKKGKKKNYKKST